MPSRPLVKCITTDGLASGLEVGKLYWVTHEDMFGGVKMYHVEGAKAIPNLPYLASRFVEVKQNIGVFRKILKGEHIIPLETEKERRH